LDLYNFQTDHGINSAILFDGEIHRYGETGSAKKPGWYVAFSTVIDGKEFKTVVVGNWRDESMRWVWKSYEESVETDKVFNQLVDKAISDSEQKRKEEHGRAAKQAAWIWDQAVDFDPKHNSYFVKKRLQQTYGTKFYSGEHTSYVVVPRTDIEGKILSIQKIYLDGTKLFQKGGKIKGTFFAINEQEAPSVIYVCEGLATGATCSDFLNYPVYVAFNSGNLLPVCEELRTKFPKTEIINLADNDQFKKTNTGFKIASKLKNKQGIRSIFPEFNSPEGEPTDFNDLFCIEGRESLERQLDDQARLLEKYPTMQEGFTYEIELKNSTKEMPDYDALSRFMVKEKQLMCDDSLVYLWFKTHYKSISFLHLKNIIDGFLKKQAAPNAVNNYYHKALIRSFTDFAERKEPVGVLNCANGLLDLKRRTLEPHSPDNFLKYCLDHNYNTKASCPEFEKALDLTTNGDADLKRLIAQVFGYCIVGGRPIAHKAFIFYGGGGNGKSTILTALMNLVGESNASMVPLTLFDKPFSMISLDGKLVNLIDETPKFNINPEAFKNVVSGGYVRAAHKGKPEMDLQINARVVFACNKLPNFKDDSDGMLRRLVIIPFNHTIKQSEKKANIDDLIKGEMSGVLNFALKGLDDLIENDYAFATSSVTDDSIDEYQKDSDSIYYFLSTYMRMEDAVDSYFLSSRVIYAKYKNICEEEKMKPTSFRVFAKRASLYFKSQYRGRGIAMEDSYRIGYCDCDGVIQDKKRKKGIAGFSFVDDNFDVSLFEKIKH